MDSPQDNPVLRRNSLIFAILMLVTHTVACFMYGFFFEVPAQFTSANFTPIFIAFAHGALVIVGFGLFFSFLKRMVWTGLAFTLLITALSMEFYFMINAFWTKADIINESTVYFSNEDKTYNLFLANQSDSDRFMSTITGAFRCGLAMIVAFSAILGRAGPLEAWIVVAVGSIGYELNRQIIENWAQDAGATNSIFVFGGFMGLVLCVLRKFKEKAPDTNTGCHEAYSANNSSSLLALLGTLFIWIFFPILAFDYRDLTIAAHTAETGNYTVIFSLAAATITAYAFSVLLNGGLLIRDIIYGPVAGGIIASSAAYYITNPVYGVLMGIIGGAVQVIIMNKVEKKMARSKDIFHTFSFALFGVQGMLGGIFAGIFNAISRGVATNGFTFNYTNEPHQVFSWVISLISMPMGIAFGLIAGVLCVLVAGTVRSEYFEDFTFFCSTDGISF